MIDGCGDFAVQISEGIRKFVVSENLVVFKSVADAAVDQTVRLQFVDQIGKGPGLFRRKVLRRVEPDSSRRTVAGQQFANLGQGFFPQITVQVRFAAFGGDGELPRPFLPYAVRFVPVLAVGVVDAEFQAVPPAAVRQFRDDVPVERRGARDGKIGILRVEHRESVMMLGRENQIFHSGSGGELHPSVRIEIPRIERGCEGLIVGCGDFRKAHDPFAEPGNLPPFPDPLCDGIESPVYEHSKTGFRKPLFSHDRMPSPFVHLSFPHIAPPGSVHSRNIRMNRRSRTGAVSSFCSGILRSSESGIS